MYDAIVTGRSPKLTKEALAWPCSQEMGILRGSRCTSASPTCPIAASMACIARSAPLDPVSRLPISSLSSERYHLPAPSEDFANDAGCRRVACQ